MDMNFQIDNRNESLPSLLSLKGELETCLDFADLDFSFLRSEEERLAGRVVKEKLGRFSFTGEKRTGNNHIFFASELICFDM